METLGQILARNLEFERREDVEAYRKRMRTEKEKQDFATAEAFFSGARDYFTRAIKDAVPSVSMYVLVDKHSTRSDGRDLHPQFAALLGYRGVDDSGPATLKSGYIGALYKEFLAWADSQELEPQWRWCHNHEDEWWWALRDELKAPIDRVGTR